MNANGAFVAIETIVALAKEFPEIISAIEKIFEALRTGQDPTPAVKAAQVAAAERFLEI